MNGSEISTVERINRTAMGSTLLGVTFYGSGPLHMLAFFPLVSIFLIGTGIVAHCPLKLLWRKAEDTMNYKSLDAYSV